MITWDQVVQVSGNFPPFTQMNWSEQETTALETKLWNERGRVVVWGYGGVWGGARKERHWGPHTKIQTHCSSVGTTEVVFKVLP